MIIYAPNMSSDQLCSRNNWVDFFSYFFRQFPKLDLIDWQDQLIDIDNDIQDGCAKAIWYLCVHALLINFNFM